MTDFNENQINVIRESKDLALHLIENEARYISGELDLNSTLNKTDELYKEIASAKTSASGVLQDSSLIKIQSKIAKERVRSYQVDTLVFDPRVFCDTIKIALSPNDILNDSNANSSRRNALSKVWEQLGEECRKVENTVPPLSFIFGTFDADPVVRKPVIPRVPRVPEKVPDVTIPQPVKPGSGTEQDIMLHDANRVYGILKALVKKTEKKVLCFYEFVTDPNSFTRTVENIFLVSLLVKEGHVCIFPDNKGLPCLRVVHPSEKQSWDNACTQSVLSISIEDWKDIVKTFKFTDALIPPRKT